MVGLSRFELLTPRLSSVCSNQLSYRPSFLLRPAVYQRLLHRALDVRTLDRILSKNRKFRPVPSKLDRRALQITFVLLQRQIDLQDSPASALARFGEASSRKEVIQPQVLLQLPCYDFTPITDHTLGACLPCGLAQRLLVQPAFVM